ncbi:uncharacterized protein Dwil_GK13129 [Drosophila willistoni]|uniref:Osiris 23 n=1 Tax=Drosophila willistoni TaxID=7260 RepID=B4NGV8_DROWI|nr:uncharacterized protein LOC6650901 [Drosophila willistoni]EDW84455.2 uncharacterized protein Dwil_GK13129 [Drosophila willistoni]
MQVNTSLFIVLLSLLLQVALGNSTQSETDTQISWIAQLKQLRHDLGQCYRTSSSLWSCFRTRSLSTFDKVMSADVIPLYEGVILKALPNAIKMQVPEDENSSRSLKYHTWFDQLAKSLAKGLTTHTLQINLAKLTERYLRSENDTPTSNVVGSARLRRHRFNMIITMMFGVTALGAVLVPMGFQMLSIVSGKALLLAKMALLLASINGLKRVANSGLHYGLYHVPGEHLGGYYDRNDLNHPRNVPIPVAVAPSLDVGLK